jgi:SAM-dependent methyltransferase
VSDHDAELRSYYEEEARQGLRKTAVAGPRLELRNRFIKQLQTEARSRVVDFGAGPGRDCAGFDEAGLRVVGLDLALANGVAARRAGLTVIHGSVLAPPFRPASFDAGWSMSTLMHLPADDMVTAVHAMAATLTPGAPLQVGLWGGEPSERVDESIAGQRRRFFSRPLDLNHSILERVGAVEAAEEWDFGETGKYQAISVRVTQRAASV